MPQSPDRKRLPIGVFDSGVGGLTVLAALRRALPAEDLLYLGDTARVPYGARSAETVRAYARRVSAHLWREGIKALVVACNTATTYALGELQRAGARRGLPVIGVIAPGVDQALARTRGDVAVLGTEGTVRGGRYQAALSPHVRRVRALACPLFVPLAEEGWTRGPVAELVAERYLGPLRGPDGPDTVILGCTHYPILRQVIAAALPGVALVDSADATAAAAAALLADAGLLHPDPSRAGRERLMVTDNLRRFRETAGRFLGREPGPAELVDLIAAEGAPLVFAEGA